MHYFCLAFTVSAYGIKMGTPCESETVPAAVSFVNRPASPLFARANEKGWEEK